MRSIEIKGQSGTIDALVFAPKSGAFPAVILFTDIAGIRAGYVAKARKIADAGYAVLMPNIYHRTVRGDVLASVVNKANPMPELMAHAAHLTPSALESDFTALIGAIEREPEFMPGPIGAVGYCLTGGFPVRLASQFPGKIAAALGFHSAGLASSENPRAIIDVIPGVKARVYFGHADKDPYLDAGQIARVDEAMAAAGIHFMTELFKGEAHGFTSDDSPAYSAAADALHHKRILSMFSETISRA